MNLMTKTIVGGSYLSVLICMTMIANELNRQQIAAGKKGRADRKIQEAEQGQ